LELGPGTYRRTLSYLNNTMFYNMYPASSRHKWKGRYFPKIYGQRGDVNVMNIGASVSARPVLKRLNIQMVILRTPILLSHSQRDPSRIGCGSISPGLSDFFSLTARASIRSLLSSLLFHSLSISFSPDCSKITHLMPGNPQSKYLPRFVYSLRLICAP
jgi:hypothetical protein